MTWWLAKYAIAATVIVIVSEIAGRSPRLGALVLTLPVVSILAFIMTWSQGGDGAAIRLLARETLVLVPLGLPFFIPFAVSDRTRLSFWTNFALGLMLAAFGIALWFKYGPNGQSRQ